MGCWPVFRCDPRPSTPIAATLATTQAPTRDTKLKRRNERFVLRGSVWRDFGIGRGTARSRVAATMDKVRDACAARLGRADLQRTPPARHEFSYTRFAPGASLARHVDEHHEETKGTEGWRAPTRRSVTWLVYLNERDVAGGRLRAYERRRPIAGDAQVGATADGDLQVGWLRASAADPVERPVFLASRLHDKEGNCALRVGDAVVSRPFHASPTLYVNADFVLQSLFLDASLAKRFQRLEELRTPLNPDPPIQGEYESRDVAPLAGRLVMYDSVAVPHEVLAVRLPRPFVFFLLPPLYTPSPRRAPLRRSRATRRGSLWRGGSTRGSRRCTSLLVGCGSRIDLITDTFSLQHNTPSARTRRSPLPERARRPPALAHGAILVRGAEPLVAFQDAGASFGAGFGPASHGHAPLLARDRTLRLRPPRRAVRVLLDVERLPRGGLSCFVDAFVKAEVVLGRFAHLVVEVARDDALVDVLLVVRVVDPVLELEELRVGERRDLRACLPLHAVEQI